MSNSILKMNKDVRIKALFNTKYCAIKPLLIFDILRMNENKFSNSTLKIAFLFQNNFLYELLHIYHQKIVEYIQSKRNSFWETLNDFIVFKRLAHSGAVCHIARTGTNRHNSFFLSSTTNMWTRNICYRHFNIEYFKTMGKEPTDFLAIFLNFRIFSNYCHTLQGLFFYLKVIFLLHNRNPNVDFVANKPKIVIFQFKKRHIVFKAIQFEHQNIFRIWTSNRKLSGTNFAQTENCLKQKNVCNFFDTT